MIKKILLITVPSIMLGICFYFSYCAYNTYSIDYIDAYVASHQISQRSIVDEDDLLKVRVPKEYLGEDVYIDKADILNKYVKLSYSIPKGSLFYKTCLETDIKDLANTLLLDNQANYDIFTNEVKINTGSLSKGMYVDLYLTINDNNKPISDLLLSNARITGLYDNNSKQILDYDTNSKVYIISLAINKEDIPIINKALLIGEIKAITSNNYNPNVVSSLNKNSALLEYLY